MNRIEEIYSVARSLPLPDRLRLAERLVHDAIEASGKQPAPADDGEDSMIGLFADKPDLIDEVCSMAMEDRATRPLRASDG